METSTVTVGDKKFFSLNQAALVYDVTVKTIHQWVKEGKMEKKKIGSATFVRMK